MKKKNKILPTKKALSLADAPLKNKIGFFSAILIVIGSAIGSGIFFKSEGILKNSQMSLIFALFSWLLAGFSVLIMGLALTEVATGNKKASNLSLVGWVKLFNSEFVYKCVKNFMFYGYLPLGLFFTPLYVTQSFQNTLSAFGVANNFGTEQDWLIFTIFALLISIYFMLTSGLNSKVASIHNNIILSIKFIPLLATVIIGFVFLGFNGTENVAIDFAKANEVTIFTKASRMTPFIGLFFSIAAIFFAYDGFYVTAGLQTEMKEPKKVPLALILGIGITTIIYLVIALSMSLNGQGKFEGFGKFLQQQNLGWLFGVLNLLITIGILGVVNGSISWAVRYTEALIELGELPFYEKFISKLNPTHPKVGVMYFSTFSYPIAILFFLIGGLGFGLSTNEKKYGAGMDGMYEFSDIISTWTSVFAFLFITVAIYGAIKNRKSNKVVVEKKKYFLPAAFTSVIINSLVFVFQFLMPFIDLFMLIPISYQLDKAPHDFIFNAEVIKRSTLIVSLFLYIALAIVPIYLEKFILKKKALESIELNK